MAAQRAEYRMPDGSLVVVETDGFQVGIERWAAGRCVWGQVFSHSYPDARAAMVAETVAAVRANPAAFDRRLLWDRDGRAVAG